MLGMVVILDRAVAHGIHQNLCVDACMFMSVQDNSSSLSECMWGPEDSLGCQFSNAFYLVYNTGYFTDLELAK